MTNVAYMQPHQDQDPDVVAYTLQCVLAMAPGFSAALAKQIEKQVKLEFGGRRFYLPKGDKRMTLEQKQEVFTDGINQVPTGEITEKHQIHKSTFFRLMKKGGRFGEE